MKFLLVGGAATLIGIVLYIIMINIFSMSPEWSKKTSGLVSVMWSFLGNQRFTFKNDGKVTPLFLKFTVLYTCTYVIDFLIHDLILSLTHYKTIAFLVGSIVSAAVNFVGLKFYVFSKKQF